MGKFIEKEHETLMPEWHEGSTLMAQQKAAYLRRAFYEEMQKTGSNEKVEEVTAPL